VAFRRFPSLFAEILRQGKEAEIRWFLQLFCYSGAFGRSICNIVRSVFGLAGWFEFLLH
jgi:hypothetical protein